VEKRLLKKLIWAQSVFIVGGNFLLYRHGMSFPAVKTGLVIALHTNRHMPIPLFPFSFYIFFSPRLHYTGIGSCIAFGEVETGLAIVVLKNSYEPIAVVGGSLSPDVHEFVQSIKSEVLG